MSEMNIGAVNRILVATDLSTRSDRALRRATLIAKRLRASLCLIHVVDGDQPQGMIEVERSEAAAVLAETAGTSCEADQVKADFKVVVADDVSESILAAADDHNVDLIVLGPHRSRFRDVFAGTTLERAVRRTRRPLLVALQPPSALYKKSLLALNFDDASRAAARGALSMGLFDQTTVTVVHAFDAPAAGMMRRSMEQSDAIDDYVDSERRAATERLRELVDELGLPRSRGGTVTVNGPPSRVIIETARNQRADLVVLGTSKIHGVKRLLIGSVAEQVLRDAERDILIIPAGQDDCSESVASMSQAVD